MATSFFRAAVGSTLALAAVLLPLQGASGQSASASGIEAARRDSIRRPYTLGDIEFMSGMIAHHAQAVKMAGWCPTHGAGKSLQIMCARIAHGQNAEIGLMQEWLRDRNQKVPEADPRGMKHVMGGMEHYMIMPGMLTEAQMAQLDSARGVEFERLFLSLMILHHKGAVSMVDTLFKTPGAGNDEIVYKFASGVYADQTTEIEFLQKLLDALPPPPAPRPPSDRRR